jgi:hypothetical protein
MKGQELERLGLGLEELERLERLVMKRLSASSIVISCMLWP